MNGPKELGVAAAIAVACCLPVVAMAQRGDSSTVALLDASGSRSPSVRRNAWRKRLEGVARAHGLRVFDWDAWAKTLGVSEGRVHRRGVEAFGEVEALLGQARMATARLQEEEALSSLSLAQRIAEAHTDVPGATAWLSEVYTQIAITAAQAERPDLSEDALQRAATLDASRGVRAAEAAPHVAARAAVIGKAVATRPVGIVRVGTLPEGARVFLDDELVGAAPATIRTVVGRHVLRIEDDEHLAYGRMLDVVEGDRGTLQVQLNLLPPLEYARALERAGNAYDADAIARALKSLADEGLELRFLWVVEVSAGPRDRALLTACDLEGCGRLLELTPGDTRNAKPDVQPPLDQDEIDRTVAEAHEWLDAPTVASRQPPGPWWKRWYVWTGVGLVLAGGITAAFRLTKPAPEQHFRTIIDSSDLALSGSHD